MKKSIYCLLLAFFTLNLACADGLKNSLIVDIFNNNPAPIPVIGQVTPHFSDINRPSYWSIGAETMDRDYAIFSKYKEYVGQTGTGYARLQSGWAKTEKKKGHYDFKWFDEHVDGLIELGVKPWVCLCYGNPIYSSHGDNLGASLFGEGKIMDGWINYVKATVKRYKGKVTMYEVWNEPDGNPKNTPEMYALLFYNTAKSIREFDPDVKIAALAICEPNRQFIFDFLDELKRLGGLEYVDYITYHAYWPNPDTIKDPVVTLQKRAKEYNPNIKILQGESGCPGQLEYSHALCWNELSERKQVKWDLRHMLTNFSAGVPSSVFTMVDLNYRWMLQSYGLIRMNLLSEPQYKRPKFYAFQNVCSIVTTDYTPDTLLKTVTKDSEGLKICGMKKGDKTVGYFLWFGNQVPSDCLERKLVDIKIEGAEIKDPVYVDMITGKVHSLSSCLLNESSDKMQSFSKLPLWDAPVLVIERSELDFTSADK